MPESDAFIISVQRAASPGDAIRGALQSAEVPPSRVQDAVFGLGPGVTLLNVEDVARAAGLTCPVATVSSGLRAIFFAGQSILSVDLDVALVIILGDESSVGLVLASPDAVGRWNLSPRARLAARSLAGADSALRAAGIAPADISASRNGKDGALLLEQVLDELEGSQARWGMVSADGLALLVERI